MIVDVLLNTVTVLLSSVRLKEENAFKNDNVHLICKIYESVRTRTEGCDSVWLILKSVSRNIPRQNVSSLFINPFHVSPIMFF